VANHVPHYDIFGHQHHREPFKDKSWLFNESISHPKWLQQNPGGVKTRSELHQARQRGRVPDTSYDFDGDGVVGQLDHFIGRSFDKDCDGRLTESERAQAKQALDQGFLNKFVRGLDGRGKDLMSQQKRGVVMMMDNMMDASAMTYPPHHNANAYPPHATATAMKLSRTAEAKSQGAGFAERYAAACAPVDEPQPPDHRTQPRTCPVSHMRERAEADHQAHRVRAGLLPMNSCLNPERELKTVGLDYTEQPMFATRGQLLDTRKEMTKRECEELALKAEQTCVPISVQKVERLQREYDFRRPDHMPMTLTRLKDQRKQDRIEHDMKYFSPPRVGPREYPRFSDNPEVPFWLADQPSVPSSNASSPEMSRSISEPALKVTHMPFAHVAARESPTQLPAAARTAAAAAGKQAGGNCYGSQTVKRWSAEMIERGEGRNKPRLFDSIQPVRIGPKDLETLDITSSMEPVRNAALARLKEENKKNAGLPKQSRLWSDPALAQAQALGGLGAAEEGQKVERMANNARQASRPNVQSEPMLRRSGLERTEVPHEPRFFGSASHIAKPGSQTAVRCGGFHRTMAITEGRQSHSQSQKSSRATRGGGEMSPGPQ